MTEEGRRGKRRRTAAPSSAATTATTAAAALTVLMLAARAAAAAAAAAAPAALLEDDMEGDEADEEMYPPSQFYPFDRYGALPGGGWNENDPLSFLGKRAADNEYLHLVDLLNSVGDGDDVGKRGGSSAFRLKKNNSFRLKKNNSFRLKKNNSFRLKKNNSFRLRKRNNSFRLKKSPEDSEQEDAPSPRGGGGRRLVTQRSTSFRLRKRNNSFRLRRKRMLPGFFFDLFGDPAEQDYRAGEMRDFAAKHLLDRRSNSAFRL